MIVAGMAQEQQRKRKCNQSAIYGVEEGEMIAVPISQQEANQFIGELHRHHKPAQGDKFRVGAEIDGSLVGVVQVGRPVARNLDNGKILEVTRMCTDGTKNACSFLYAKAARIAKELGYEKIITYILETEDGTSLKAAGWVKEANTSGGEWNCISRPRKTSAPTCPKQRWSKTLI